MPKNTKPLMSTQEAAALIGCSVNHIYTLIRSKKLKAKQQECRFNGHGYAYVITRAEANRVRIALQSRKGRGWKLGQSRKNDKGDTNYLPSKEEIAEKCKQARKLKPRAAG